MAGLPVKQGEGPGQLRAKYNRGPHRALFVIYLHDSQAERFPTSLHGQTARRTPQRKERTLLPRSHLSSSRGKRPCRAVYFYHPLWGNGTRLTSPFPSKPAASARL